MALTKDQLIEEIKGLSVLDLADLVKALEEEFGVSAAAPVAMATVQGVAGTAEAAAAEAEEQTEFTVTLKDFGSSKINVIKAVREGDDAGAERGERPSRKRPDRHQRGHPQRRSRRAEREAGRRRRDGGGGVGGAALYSEKKPSPFAVAAADGLYP